MSRWRHERVSRRQEVKESFMKDATPELGLQKPLSKPGMTLG